MLDMTKEHKKGWSIKTSQPHTQFKLVIHLYHMEVLVELQLHTVGQRDLVCMLSYLEPEISGIWIM